jgi:DNA (cytosine-5)-methyltransferase 1
MTRKDGKSRADMLDWAVEYQTGMRLNPTWVEWLMAWPLGWTDLKPLAMDKCQSVPPPHGDCSQARPASSQA